MVTKKMFSSIDQLQKVQYLAANSGEDVGIHSLDGKIIVDAKSFIGIFALNFKEPVLVVSEDPKFHEEIKGIGETVE